MFLSERKVAKRRRNQDGKYHTYDRGKVVGRHGKVPGEEEEKWTANWPWARKRRKQKSFQKTSVGSRIEKKVSKINLKQVGKMATILYLNINTLPLREQWLAGDLLIQPSSHCCCCCCCCCSWREETRIHQRNNVWKWRGHKILDLNVAFCNEPVLILMAQQLPQN